MSEYGTKVYHKAGGDKVVVKDGGEIEVQSGGTLDVQSGATLNLGGVTLGATAGQDITITSGNDMLLQSGPLAADVVKIQAYDVGVTTYEDMITAAAHATLPTLVLHASGGTTINSGLTLSDAAGTGASVIGCVAGQDLTITSGDDFLLQTGPLAADVVKIQAYDVGVTTYEDIITASAHGTLPTLVLHATGGTTINSAVVLSDAAGTGAGSLSAVAGQAISINLSDNVATALDIQEATNDYITCVTTDGLEEIEFGKPVDMELGRKVETYFEIFDDFLYQAITENDTPWVLNAGTDTLAIDAAILATQENGVIRLETGDASGTFSADASQMVCHIPMRADNGGLVFETRLNIDTAVTDISVNMGFTDTTALEEPFSIAAGAYTSNAADAAVFVYDTDATDDVLHMCAVDGDTDDAGCASIAGTLPVADTFAVYRIEVSADGATIKFFIDGVLEGTLTGDAGVSPDVDLFATVTVNSTTTTAKDLDLDYIFAGVVRG